MARIFVCTDTGQAALIDSVAEALEAKGHQIVRGSRDTPGVRKEYSKAECETLIAMADAAVFTTRHACSRELMTVGSRLRGIVYPVIGVESLDLSAANDLGIIVGHGAVRGNIIGMAESTVMLMLMCLYDVQTNMALLQRGEWRRAGHHSRQMEGKTIGLIGFGRIAREVAHRLEPFRVRIVTYSPRVREDDLPAGVEKVGLDTLMAMSDVVSVLTGLTPETFHMIDENKLGLMKPGAYLVNTGRGAVIDEDALVDALAAQRIAGAALDTFAVEPLPADSRLRGLPNVILTPHCVGHTIEGYDEFAPTMIENLERILRGDLPLHCKNPEAELSWRDRLARLDA